MKDKLSGTRLINSVKNLAINAKGAVVHGDQEQTIDPAKPTTGHSVSDWQRQWEEDDESDDDDDDAKLPASQLRPGMDEGYSQASVAAMPNADPRMLQSAAPRSPQKSQPATMPVTPGRDGVIRSSPSPRQYTTQLSDGVEWDTGAQVMPRKEKPSIEMFLPMLRVLGKGSFGKVRVCKWHRQGAVVPYIPLLTSTILLSILAGCIGSKELWR